MALNLQMASWSIPGMFSEKRPLEKDGKAWAYSAKVVAMGGTYEVQTRDRAVFDGLQIGVPVVVTGSFEQYAGNLRLVLGNVTLQKPS